MKIQFVPSESDKTRKPIVRYLLCYAPTELDYAACSTCIAVDDPPSKDTIEEFREGDELYLGYIRYEV